MRRAFPKKHLRITIDINALLNNSMEKNMKRVVESSGLEPWNGSYGNPWGLEYLDFSWRFKSHWAVGAGFLYEFDGLGNYSYLVSD